MWIKPLRVMSGTYGQLKGKVPVNLPDDIAEQLVKQGRAVPCQSPKAAKAALTEVAKKAAEGPTKTHPNGGQDGTEKQSSSSPAARAPEKKSSKSSKDDAE